MSKENTILDVELFENERIDDLQFKGLKIIQNTKGFCFGIDAVLLSNFCKVKKNSKVIDLGTGTGIIPLLVAGKSNAKEIVGLEIQSEVAEMARRSVKMNGLEDRIKIINGDLKSIETIFSKQEFDVVVSNPPYAHANGIVNENDKKAISRHGIMCDIEDVIKAASFLLKPNGRFFMVNRPLRLVDMLHFGRVHNLEAKNIRFVHSREGKSPKLVLIEYLKYGKPEVKVLDPLYVYEDGQKYTKEILDIYSTRSIEY